MARYIEYGRQWIDEDDVAAVVEVLRGPLITTGPKVEEFEAGIAAAAGAKYAVAVANGTAALHAACFAAGIGPGDEVITSALTFAASANCALYVGATPVFADVDPKTYNIDPDEIERKITARTKAIIPVHFTGQPCAMDEIMAIARRHGIMVIADGAHALGAAYKGRPIGSIGDMTTFSFHPVKPITTGEGGAIVTDRRDLFERLMLFRTHGITRRPDLLTAADEGLWYYEQQVLGYNYRLTDIQAALGISQLKKLARFNDRRREIARQYDAAFGDLPGVVTPYQAPESLSSGHLYIIALDLDRLNVGRRQIFDALRQRGIGANVHYIPVYRHPYYQRLGYPKGLCPRAEELYERFVTLPLYPKMSDDDVTYVISSVRDVVKAHLK